MRPVTTLPLLSPEQVQHRKRGLGTAWDTALSLLSREQRDHRKTLPTAGSTFQAPQDPRLKRLPNTQAKLHTVSAASSADSLASSI